MLEKIGLPEKPSMRGGNWVVDASHCQGCSQQFTFINRKHHCRRCGGIFCNGCTQQRMVLRGQGDSAVRICDPCKEIEEAARFELRYGKRNRATKSNTKPVTKNEGELLKELLDVNKLASKPVQKSRHEKIPDLVRETSSSGSSLQNSSIPPESVDDSFGSASTSVRNNMRNKIVSSSPEELAMQEKNKSKLLKADGKHRGVHAALKHGKELEKQAATLKIASSSSSSSSQYPPESVENIIRSISTGAEFNVQNEFCSSNPEEMRRLAVEEKSKYRLLKAEGKPEEALAAFKRGKELEKQAAALDVAIRKSRRLASIQKPAEDQDGTIDKKKTAINMKKAGKDDLTNELMELGWSDADLRDADKKQEPLSLEGELSSILREIPQKSQTSHISNGLDRSEVVTLKKKALMLKREGKLAEAKEELKQAKILEKQLEEHELLAGAEDSDDELSSLIRSMDAEKQEHFSSELSEPGINFDDFTNLGDDFAFGGNFNVTDDDMNDPEIAASLKSFGWSEDDDNPGKVISHSSSENVSEEIRSLKKEAVNQKRAGNLADAKELLRKAKLLEQDLIVASEGNIQNFEPSLASDHLKPQFPEEAKDHVRHIKEKVTPTDLLEYQRPNKSKLAIQKELLALKRKALALRREGRVEEAEEELRKGKSLEQQLEEIENPQKFVASEARYDNNNQESQLHERASTPLGLIEAADDAEVTEQDMKDPTLLSDLENLGWIDDLESSKKPKLSADPSDDHSAILKVPRKPTKSRGELQRELLGIKRKALALRRQGKSEEAEEELRRAKVLEDQLAELDSCHQLGSLAESGVDNVVSSLAGKRPEIDIMTQDKLKADMQSKNVDLSSLIGCNDDMITLQSKNSDGHTPAQNLVEIRADIQKEPLTVKKSPDLRHHGMIDDSNEDLNKSNNLESLLAKTEVGQGFHVMGYNSANLHLPIEPENLVTCPMTKDLNELTENKGMTAKASDGSLSNLSDSVKFPTSSSATQSTLLSEPIIEETVSIKPLSSQSLKMQDLLPADKNDVPFTVEQHDQITHKRNPVFSDSSLQINSQPFVVQTGINCKEDPGNLQDSSSATFTEGATGVQSLGKELNAPEGLHSTKDQILELKKRAVALKREGKVAEALEELRQAKLLEKSLDESSHKENAAVRTGPVSLPDHVPTPNKNFSSPPQRPMSTRERFKLQQESLSHKRQALKLRREGKNAEADALVELAKKLEAQIQEADGTDTDTAINRGDASLVEDFIDPQLMSALEAIGWDEKDITSQALTTKKSETKNENTSSSRKANSTEQMKLNVDAHAIPSEVEARKSNASTYIGMEKSHLEEQIKNEKLRALNLKRAGKQSDALEALRAAKRLEKKLESLSA